MRHLTWQEVDYAAGALVDQIRASGFQPDYLIGIAQGGLVPLGMISKRLDNVKTLIVTARSYKNRERGEAGISYMPSVDLVSASILLVDEIADSGATLKKVLVLQGSL